MKRIQWISVCILTSTCLSASAVQVVSNVHYFSRVVVLPSLAEDLRNAESLAEERRFADAATALQLVLESGNPEIRQVLDADNSAEGPLAFQMKVTCVRYGGLAAHWGDPAEIETIKGLIESYKSASEAPSWPDTARLYGILLSDHNYGYAVTPSEKQALYEEWLSRDPLNAAVLNRYVAWAMTPGSLADQTIVLAKVEAFQSSDGTMTPALGLACIELQKKTNPDQTVIDGVLAWLKAHPTESIALIEKALALARAELDSTQPDQVVRYYANLTGLALKQPGGDDRVPLTALIMNEKRKLEAVMPELKSE
jgi:hypothetical protein